MSRQPSSFSIPQYKPDSTEVADTLLVWQADTHRLEASAESGTDTIRFFEYQHTFSKNETDSFEGPASHLIGLIFLLCMGLIALARFLDPKSFSNLMQAVNPLKINKLISSGDEVQPGFSFVLLILFSILSLSASLVSINEYYQVVQLESRSALIYEGLFLGFVLVYLLYKIIIVFLSSFIFRQQESAEHYFRNLFNYLLAMSVMVFPFAFFHYYTQWPLMVFIILFISVIFFILNLISSYIIGLRISRISHFYIILYLCVLEIAPLLWIYALI